MARDKKHALAVATAGRSAKERHQRAGRDKNAWTAPVTRELVALPEKNIKSKHQSYFQIFENHDKKAKKLEFQVSSIAVTPSTWTIRLLPADYNRQASSPWIRVRTHRQSGTYQSMQGAFKRARGNDLHRLCKSALFLLLTICRTC